MWREGRDPVSTTRTEKYQLVTIVDLMFESTVPLPVSVSGVRRSFVVSSRSP